MSGSGDTFPFFRGKLKLKQPEKHRVSVDLVLFLSRLKGIKRTSKVVDLGAGFGFLSIAVAKKWGCEVFALERNPLMFELLIENIRINGLGGKVKAVRGDVRSVEDVFSKGEFDVVVLNPPFFPKDYGKEDGGFHFESDTTLGDFLRAGSYLLRDGGYLNLLVPSFRLYETFGYMRDLNLPVRFMGVLYPTIKKKGKLCILTSIKNVPGPLDLEPPILINEPEGGYTQEVERLLEGFL